MTVYQRLFRGASSLRSLPFARQVLTGVKAGVVVHLFLEYFYSINLTYGPSMLPTLNFAGDWVLVDKSFRWGNNVVVGDLVSFKTPIEPGKGAIKRVVGMPGDFVERDSPGKGRGMTLQVPAGHCFLVGDNLAHSRDSRLYGAVPLALIKGKPIARVWPDPMWLKNGLKATD